MFHPHSPWVFACAVLLCRTWTAVRAATQQDINGPISMPNLGRGFSLGSLYDARTDERIGGFLWPLSVLKDPKFVKELNAKKSKYKMVYDDTYADKASLVEVGAELALKAKAKAGGFGAKASSSFKLSGSAEFMSNSKTTSSQVRASVAYKLRSFQQVLDVFHPDIRAQMHSKVVADKRATHVVAGVTYGSDCIATFTYKTSSLKEKTMAKTFLKTKMSALGSANLPFKMAGAEAKTELETELSASFEGKTFSTSSGVTVDILGDVIPFGNETLPMDVDDAVDFLKRLHQHGIGDGGVPMDLALIPIAWLDDAAAKLKRKLDSSKIDEALKIVVELDTSVESLSDLLEIDSDGFIAWEITVHVLIKELESFRANMTQDMSEAIDMFRDGGDTSLLTDVFNKYYNSDHHSAAISVLAEQKRDEIINLKAFVSSMKEQAAVPTAEHFSDYMAPSLDQKYDRVYILLLVGMNPSRHRSSMGLVKDFTAYAASFLTGRSPTSWCQTATVRGQTLCLTNYWFGAIHFDSFCEQFCKPQYCNPVPRTCSNPTASAALTFGSADRDAWCQNPCTMILGFAGNDGPFRADTRLVVLPNQPKITSVSGADDTQADPYRQKVTLTVQPPSRGTATNYRVRVTWLESSEIEGGSGWMQRQTTFDTMEDTTSIVVRKLIAGRKYTFSVAGINLVGVGPFSDEYRLPDGKMLRIAQPMVTIVPVPDFAIARNNSGPAWKSFNIKAMLSMPGEEPIGSLSFRSVVDGSTFGCEEYSGATTEEVSCLLRGPRPLTMDTVFEVTATNKEGDEILGMGNFTYQVQTGDTCYNTEKELRLLCNATRRCVSSCSECVEVEIDSNGVPARKNTTEVTGQYICLSDVCPDIGGLRRVWCPASTAISTCFRSSGSTADCRSNCDGLSVYHSGSDVCAVPCKVGFTGGISQACSTVMPGESCAIQCSKGYINNGGSPTTFQCPPDNAQEIYDPGDAALTLPSCTASCALVSCPIGWTAKANPGNIAGKTNEVCCDELECAVGKWGPTEPAPCESCRGATRRRRATSCTNCPSGYIPSAGQDDCEPYCKSFTCPSGYQDKATKDEIAGKDRNDCCDEITCTAGLYVAGGKCLTCNGAVRRRRATSCSSCGWSDKDGGNVDDCVRITSIGGYTRMPADCQGGDISKGTSTRSIASCAATCNAAQSWFARCAGFAYRYTTSTCKIKTASCKQLKGSYSLTGWSYFKKR